MIVTVIMCSTNHNNYNRAGKVLKSPHKMVFFSCNLIIFSRNPLASTKFAWGLSVIFPCGNYCSNYRGNGTFGVTALFELSHSHTISYCNKKIVPFPLP